MTGNNLAEQKASLGRRALAALLSGTMALSLSGALPLAAYASEADVQRDWAQAADTALDDESYSAYSYATPLSEDASAAEAEDASTLPDKFDLRDRGVVTPVKNQSPWGTCWGFAAIAAAETSILSEARTTYEATGLDLSELQLVDAVTKGAPESVVGCAQAGEGYNNTTRNPNYGLDIGGTFIYASGVFAGGIGPALESAAPYQNSEGLIECYVQMPGEEGYYTFELTQSQIAEKEKQGCTVRKLWWTGNYDDTSSEGESKKVYTTWKVSDDLWNMSFLEFENGNILPDTVIANSDGSYGGLDTRAVEAIKSEMYEYGRAVGVGFCADNSMPSDSGVAKYIDKSTWSHYTYERQTANHAVTIVGWDDTYSKDKFRNQAGKTPEGDGAWLVKNSWGAENEDFPNTGLGNWGIVDEETQKHTGYFWLSYYDRTLTAFETYDFDLNSYDENDEYLVDAYDFLPQDTAIITAKDEPQSSANVFTTTEDLSLRTLGCATYKPNTTVAYEVYLLDGDAKTPTDAGHSKLACTLDATYEYGGYHRTTLDESKWIAMRKGQRFAVVTTQKCNDDGKYYVGVAANKTKPTQQQIGEYEKAKREYYTQNMYDLLYAFYYDSYFSEHKSQGMDDDAAKAAALADIDKLMDARKEIIEKDVASDVDTYSHSYFVSKVNEGESFVSSYGDGEAWTAEDFSARETSDIEWTDWTVLKRAVESRKTDIVVDNAPIKAVSEMREWASVEQLEELEELIAQAKELLSLKVSVDGSDVPEGEMWITQEVHDVLEAAIPQAEALLANSGDYRNELANTTPTPDEVKAAVAALGANAQQGLMPAGSGNGDGDEANTTTAKGKLAKTADPAACVLLGLACAAVAAGGCVYAARRRMGR